MTVLLLSGSPSSPSRSARLLHAVGEKLHQLGQQTLSLHVRDLPAQALLHADFSDPELQAAKALVAQADVIVVATPIYKAAYSGLLKSFLDILPQDGLDGKIILPLATGGSQSHMLAIDYGLRPVLASLSARHVLPGIYATDAQVVWTDLHGLQIDGAIQKRIQDATSLLLDSLHGLRRPQPSKAPVLSVAHC
ncbi:NADPH-dependent FMN reductase [Undibacterium sp. TJN19]|uniref:NADPH-dependent FMN reductase n=1 Tax=Undibacterium sp. TJN19 TaxID=3413055 RepID=UPI003BF2F615